MNIGKSGENGKHKWQNEILLGPARKPCRVELPPGKRPARPDGHGNATWERFNLYVSDYFHAIKTVFPVNSNHFQLLTAH